MASQDLVSSINTISSFLAFPQITDLQDLQRVWNVPEQRSQYTHVPPVDVVVICASAVLHTADIVFTTLKSYKALELPHAHEVVLVLCGGRGHSTQLLYDAVAAHPRYHVLLEEISGLPEARVLEVIAERFFELQVTKDARLDPRSESASPRISVVVEDQSTNCGANASKTKQVLDTFGVTSPKTIVICQDPTMCRRTVASFQHTYSGSGNQGPEFFSWPTFAPAVTSSRKTTEEDPLEGRDDPPLAARLRFGGSAAGDHGSVEGLWAMSRFLDLIVGEIPRLRNDDQGYGPKGRGFISAVDIFDEVEAAWKVVSDAVKGERGDGEVGGRAHTVQS